MIAVLLAKLKAMESWIKLKATIGAFLVCFCIAIAHDVIALRMSQTRMQAQLDQFEAQMESYGLIHCPKDSSLALALDRKCIYLSKNESVTYYDANEKCSLKGGKLYEPRNRMLYDMVVEKVDKEMQIEGIFGPWIGVNDINTENTWVYESTGETVEFDDFASMQPDNHEGDEHCVHLSKTDGPFAWNDIGCQNKLGFICEVPMK